MNYVHSTFEYNNDRVGRICRGDFQFSMCIDAHNVNTDYFKGYPVHGGGAHGGGRAGHPWFVINTHTHTRTHRHTHTGAMASMVHI